MKLVCEICLKHNFICILFFKFPFDFVHNNNIFFALLHTIKQMTIFFAYNQSLIESYPDPQ